MLPLAFAAKIAPSAEEAGFQEVKIDIVSVAKKPYGEYPIFLLTGRKLINLDVYIF